MAHNLSAFFIQDQISILLHAIQGKISLFVLLTVESLMFIFQIFEIIYEFLNKIQQHTRGRVVK